MKKNITYRIVMLGMLIGEAAWSRGVEQLSIPITGKTAMEQFGKKGMTAIGTSHPFFRLFSPVDVSQFIPSLCEFQRLAVDIVNSIKQIEALYPAFSSPLPNSQLLVLDLSAILAWLREVTLAHKDYVAAKSVVLKFGILDYVKEVLPVLFTLSNVDSSKETDRIIPKISLENKKGIIDPQKFAKGRENPWKALEQLTQALREVELQREAIRKKIEELKTLATDAWTKLGKFAEEAKRATTGTEPVIQKINQISPKETKDPKLVAACRNVQKFAESWRQHCAQIAAIAEQIRAQYNESHKQTGQQDTVQDEETDAPKPD
ncbi:MAG: hypothetical protein LBG20_02410 [Holosporaceae bacterium]|jgi:hypothetical protein|nr:hypothetical protein [Holosporaceae bacterium]